MARKSNEQKLTEKHQAFIAEFDSIWVTTESERRQAVEDRRFYSIAGAQWEDELGDQFDNVTRLEMNKIHLAVIRIFSEYRNNRISVDFRPKDTDSSSDTAETLTGLYRADEQESTAQEAYDNSFEEGVGGGMGAWRLRNVYDDPDAEYQDEPEDEDEPGQRIAIEPIFDADSSVFFDLDAKRQDKADATRCYLLVAKARAAWMAEHPGEEPPASINQVKPGVVFDWYTPDVVYVAEVFEVEKKNDTVQVWRSTLTDEERTLDKDEAEDADYTAELTAQGFRYVRDMNRRYRKVRKYEMDGEKIRKDCGYIAGKCIPVVPYYGKRWYVDNVERFMGHVRLAKDAQRLFNMLISRLGEIASITPYEVPIVSPAQIAGHEVSWATGNVKRSAYRLLNPVLDAQGNPMPAAPQSYVKPPDVPPVLAALVNLAGISIDELTGKAGEQDEMISNISGKAVELINTRLDMQSFIYTDNMAKAMKRSGQIWLSMKRDMVPDKPHSAAIIKPDGTPDFVDMMKPTKDKDGKTVIVNDVTKGKFGVWSDVGPSFNSRRDATVRGLTNMMSLVQDPQLASVLASVAIMNMDGEGLKELREYMRKRMISIGAVAPTEEEKAALEKAAQGQPPDANTEFLMASARKESALATKAEADTVQSLAKAEQLREATQGDSVATTLAVIQATNGTAVPPATAPGAA